MNKSFAIIFLLTFGISEVYSQNQLFNINLVNTIYYKDTSFIELPGNAFIIDIGGETLAVTCKHTLWTNKPNGLKNVDLSGILNIWKLVVPQDTLQYIILGELINSNSSETIGEYNVDEDFLVFKIKENHSNIIPLKLSTKLLTNEDTIFKQGLTFQTKNALPKRYTAIVKQYYGASLLINNLENINYAGLSGSPVLNVNNELVGIVSSWKYHLPDNSWHEAICSTDYLWIVLYKYWLKKNNLNTSIETFKLFLDDYENKNHSRPKISTYVFSKLFYNAINKSIENYKQWIIETNKKYGFEIKFDDYQKSILIFETWKTNFISDKSNFEDLKSEIKKENSVMSEMLEFCKFSQELINKNKFDKAIDLLIFVDTFYQHAGQLYAFIGDAYFAKGDKTKAKEYYQKCIQTYPDHPQAQTGLEKINN